MQRRRQSSCEDLLASKNPEPKISIRALEMFHYAGASNCDVMIWHIHLGFVDNALGRVDGDQALRVVTRQDGGRQRLTHL